MPQEPFINPKIKGTRFDGGVIPLEFLKDLTVFEEMVIEVAKMRYRSEHPNRQRAPRGFMDGVSLKLTGIEDGSAVPVIALDYPQEGLFAPEVKEYIDFAREEIVQLIDSAGTTEPMELTDIQRKILPYFDRMGRSLRNNESMEFPISTCPNRMAVLTHDVRRRLVLASDKIKEFTEEMSIRGLVPEADQDSQTFELKLYDGRDIKAPITAQHREVIMEAFNGYSDGLRIQLGGVVRVNREGKVLDMVSIESASLLDPLDVLARLDDFRLLKKGWLDGYGMALSAAGLDWLSTQFTHHYPGDLRLPYLYPTEDGGIQAEWSLGEVELSLTIDINCHIGEWHTLNMQSGEEDLARLALDDRDAWKTLCQKLRDAGGELS